jgi:hypothetical protein
MSMADFIENTFYVVAVINIILAIWSMIEWGICFKINHTKYRWLYLLWIFTSFTICILYLGITLSTNPGNIMNAPWYMIAIRPILTSVLASSALTAEAMRIMRTKRILNEPK